MTKYGHDSRGFSWKFEANEMRAPCFWEDGSFSTKYGLESSVFFTEWTFFYKIWAWEQWFFLNPKKVTPIDFFDP